MTIKFDYNILVNVKILSHHKRGHLINYWLNETKNVTKNIGNLCHSYLRDSHAFLNSPNTIPFVLSSYLILMSYLSCNFQGRVASCRQLYWFFHLNWKTLLGGEPDPQLIQYWIVSNVHIIVEVAFLIVR